MLSNNNRLKISALFLFLCLQACGGGGSQGETEMEVPTMDLPESEVPLVPSLGQPKRIYGPNGFLTVVDGENGFFAGIDSGDRFARDHDRAGDIDGDGVIDLVIGARSDDDGATDAGAVYILFMNSDGSVKSNQKISAVAGDFTGDLSTGSFFGYGVAGIGDYDGDTIPDIAVSAPGGDIHTVYILHLNSDGSVKSMVSNPGITAFGLNAIGDLNADGKIDLVAGDPNHVNGGAIHLLFFNDRSELQFGEIVTIGENLGGFGEGLGNSDSFGGRASALLGDIDGDGNPELAVGAFQSEGGVGAIWILSLDGDTSEVIDKRKIAPGLSGFNETISADENPNGTSGGQFGHAMVAAGDLNGDGIPDLITGANQFDDGVGYILYLNTDKSVKTFTRLNSEEGGFDLFLEPFGRFSRSMSFVDSSTDSGDIKVNMGGFANGTGGFYVLSFQACTVTSQAENSFWSEGTTLYSNWDHESQTVTGPLSQEQCELKAFEQNASNLTTKETDGRCIIKGDGAILVASDEGSTAYQVSCP